MTTRVFPLLLAFVLPVSAAMAQEKKSRSKPIDNRSPVERFSFGATLEAQEQQLAANPLLKQFRQWRKERRDGKHEPTFHFTSPEPKLNDPNGLCFWNGHWHMFYQAYPPEYPRQHWGHAVSDDLIHWRDLPYAIYPGPERACFSGSVYIDDETNRAIAMYHGTEVGSMVAISDDPLLLNWKKVTGKSVIPYPEKGQPKVPFNIFDPCIWKKGDWYYALTSGPKGKLDQFRSMYLHRSKDLATWEHLHEFLENDRFSLRGDDGACPYFWPIGTGDNQKHILCHFSHMSGGKYMLGNYDTNRDKFEVEFGGDFNFGAWGPNGLHAPSAYPDGNGGVMVIFNVNEPIPNRFRRIMSLPRRLTLRDGFEFNPLNIEPVKAIESLRGEHVRVGRTTIPANEELVIDQVTGTTLELIAEIAPSENQTLELGVLRSGDGEEVTRIQCFRDRGMRVFGKPVPTVVSIDSSRSTIAAKTPVRPPETALVEMKPNEPLRLRVFIDRSIVEVFVNDRQCLTARVYPDREDSVGVSLRAQGEPATLNSLDAWQMGSIYK